MNTFAMNNTLINFAIPVADELKALRRAQEVGMSAMIAGADMDYMLQEKWERILLFFEGMGT